MTPHFASSCKWRDGAEEQLTAVLGVVAVDVNDAATVRRLLLPAIRTDTDFVY
jgi:hypothetical protein